MLETAPTAIHRGEEELPFIDLGDGTLLQLLQVDLANGVWVVRNQFAPGTTVAKHKQAALEAVRTGLDGASERLREAVVAEIGLRLPHEGRPS